MRFTGPSCSPKLRIGSGPKASSVTDCRARLMTSRISRAALSLRSRGAALRCISDFTTPYPQARNLSATTTIKRKPKFMSSCAKCITPARPSSAVYVFLAWRVRVGPCKVLHSVAKCCILSRPRLLMPIPSRVRGSPSFPSGFRLSRLSLRESVTGGLGGACPFRLWPRVALAGVSVCAIIGDGGKSGFLLFVG